MATEREIKALIESEQPLSEVKPTFKAVIYGPIGVGKTYLAMHLAHSLSAGKDIIYVDYAEGWTAIKDDKEITSHSRRFTYGGFKQLLLLAEAIKSKATGFENVGAVVLDEYSSMIDNNLEEIVKKMYKENPGKYDEYLPEWPHFNRSKVMATRLHRTLNHIEGVHVIYLAHAKERVDKDTEQVFTEPNFNPSYGKDFLQDLQLVGYMTASVRNDKYTRTIQTQPEKRVAAKNRLGLSTKASPEELVDAVKKFIAVDKEEKKTGIKPIVVD